MSRVTDDLSDDVLTDRFERGLEQEPGAAYTAPEHSAPLGTTCCTLCLAVVALDSVTDEGVCRACVLRHETVEDEIGLRSMWSMAR